MGPPPATTFLAEPSLSLVQTLAAPGQIGDGLVDELLWGTARGPVQTPRELVTRLVLRRWVLLLLRPQPSLDFASRRVIHDIQVWGALREAQHCDARGCLLVFCRALSTPGVLLGFCMGR